MQGSLAADWGGTEGIGRWILETEHHTCPYANIRPNRQGKFIYMRYMKGQTHFIKVQQLPRGSDWWTFYRITAAPDDGSFLAPFLRGHKFFIAVRV